VGHKRNMNYETGRSFHRPCRARYPFVTVSTSIRPPKGSATGPELSLRFPDHLKYFFPITATAEGESRLATPLLASIQNEFTRGWKTANEEESARALLLHYARNMRPRIRVLSFGHV